MLNFFLGFGLGVLFGLFLASLLVISRRNEGEDE